MRIHHLALPVAVAVAAAALAATAGHLPATCADPCDVLASFAGYAPPVVVVANGTNVTWTSLDGTHVQADRPLLPAFPECFSASGGAGVTTAPVRFTVNGTKLEATTGGATAECLNASPLDEKSFELPYYCKLHPTMRGSIVVTA